MLGAAASSAGPSPEGYPAPLAPPGVFRPPPPPPWRGMDAEAFAQLAGTPCCPKLPAVPDKDVPSKGGWAAPEGSGGRGNVVDPTMVAPAAMVSMINLYALI